MSWTRIGAILPAVLAGCAKVVAAAEGMDGGGAGPPTVTKVEPEPGLVSSTASFVVHFAAPMDEGALLARSGRSETVALAVEADVERAAAALEHGSLSAHERTLLLPAAASVASDRRSLTLAPDLPLGTGGYFLLVSPRLKDELGRKIGGSTLRFGFRVGAEAQRARLVTPAAGCDAPTNLGMVRALAPSGRVALLGPDGAAVSAAEAHGEVALPIPAPLVPGSRYTLSVEGAAQSDQSFTVASCARVAPPALQGGTAQILARDTSVDLHFKLDWPAQAEIRIGKAALGEPCAGECIIATRQIACSPPACGPQVFACAADVHVGGLIPATGYSMRLVLRDDEGHAASGASQRFATVAPLPRMLISEVKPSPTAGEYVELLNLGPGAADVSRLALLGHDGVVRAVSGAPPPLPLLLQPGARALAVGASFDPSLYPSMPPGTPVMRAATRRLFGRGLADRSTAAFQLVLAGELPVELADFPGGVTGCPADASLQRDETVPPDGVAAWTCGKAGGTPGAPP